MNNQTVKLLSMDENTALVGGYGVLFGGQDLTGEIFEFDTDYQLKLVPVKPVLYDHGLGEVKHEIGAVKLEEVRDIGIWYELQLDRSKKYVDYVLKLIDKNVLGLSTGTAEHLTRKEGKAIKKWPIIEVSLTPTPAEPRTLGVERLKALAQDYPELEALIPQGSGEDPVSAGTGINKPTIKITMEERTMPHEITLSMEEYKELLKSQMRAPDAPPEQPKEAEDPAIKAVSDRLDALIDTIQKSPTAKDAGYIAPDSEGDKSEVKSLADFLIAVRNKNDVRIKSVYKTALAEDAGATGGYVIPTQFVSPIMAAAQPFSVLRNAGATIVPMNGPTASVPALDIETAPSAGDTSYAAGVVAVWEAEAAALDESEPRFRMVQLQAHKMAGYSLASNEFISDSPQAVDSLLATLFGRAIGSKENYAFFRGDGVGKPMGILNSGALVSVTRATGSKIDLSDLADMLANFLPTSWGSGAWFANPKTAEQLIQLVSNPLTWLENMRGPVPMRLLGMPLYFTGALPGLNTAGDLLLVDPSYYLIGDRESIDIAYSEHYKFTNDQGTWRFRARVDGQPWIDNKITLEDGSSTVSPFVAIAAG